MPMRFDVFVFDFMDLQMCITSVSSYVLCNGRIMKQSDHQMIDVVPVFFSSLRES